MPAEKPPLSKPPGEAKILCEQCLRGSGWGPTYRFKPGADEHTRCQNCDRPAIVRQPRRNEIEPHRRASSKSMQEATKTLERLKAELKLVTGGESVH